MAVEENHDVLQFAKLHISNLHEIWRNESPEFGYYPHYQDVNQKSFALIDQLKIFKGLSVLDIGCNSGFYSCLAALCGASVVGCDIEDVLISRARDSAAYFDPYLGSGKVEFRKSSFVELLSDEFEGILASLVLYHVGDEALEALGRYLKKNRPVVLLQARPSRARAFLANPEWGTVSNTKAYGGMYSIESNLDFLRDCGYESVSICGLSSTLFYGETFPVIIAHPD